MCCVPFFMLCFLSETPSQAPGTREALKSVQPKTERSYRNMPGQLEVLSDTDCINLSLSSLFYAEKQWAAETSVCTDENICQVDELG